MSNEGYLHRITIVSEICKAIMVATSDGLSGGKLFQKLVWILMLSVLTGCSQNVSTTFRISFFFHGLKKGPFLEISFPATFTFGSLPFQMFPPPLGKTLTESSGLMLNSLGRVWKSSSSAE